MRRKTLDREAMADMALIEEQLGQLPRYQPHGDAVGAALRRARSVPTPSFALFRPTLAVAAVVIGLGGFWLLRVAREKPTTTAAVVAQKPAVPTQEELDEQLTTMQTRLGALRPGSARRTAWRSRNTAHTATRISRLRNRLEKAKQEWDDVPPVVEQDSRNERRRHA